MNKQSFLGTMLDVDILKKKEERSVAETESFTNLFVQGFNSSINDKELKALFAPYGELDSCMVKLKDGQHTGTGFVSFIKSEDAQKAMIEMNRKQTAGGVILVSRFVNKKDNLLTKEGLTPIAQNMKVAFQNNIFVNFIPLDVTED